MPGKGRIPVDCVVVYVEKRPPPGACILVEAAPAIVAEIRQGLWPSRLVASVWVQGPQEMVKPAVVQL